MLRKRDGNVDSGKSLGKGPGRGGKQGVGVQLELRGHRLNKFEQFWQLASDLVLESDLRSDGG